jgi:hypothetical protein
VAEVAGLLMCRAGPHRLAFLAEHVRAIEAAEARAFPCARTAFALPAEAGRVLLGEGGDAVTVDSLEVNQHALALLDAPPMIHPLAGQSVFGFVADHDGLWPVIRLPEFCAFLGGVKP